MIDKDQVRGPSGLPSLAADESDDLRALIYGIPGGGKTALLGTAVRDPRTNKALLLDLEGGTKTIRSVRRFVDFEMLGDPQEGLIDILRIKTYEDLKRAYDFIFDRKFKDKRASYNFVGGDSLTEINYMSLKYMVGKTPPGVARLEADVPEQRDYLKSNNSMKDMMRAFRDIEGLHVIWTALQQERVGGDGTKVEMIKPSLVGKLAEEAMAIVDVVGHMKFDTMTKKHVLYLKPEGRFVAKARTEVSDNPVTKIEDPTITKLLDVLGIQ